MHSYPLPLLLTISYFPPGIKSPTQYISEYSASSRSTYPCSPFIISPSCTSSYLASLVLNLHILQLELCLLTKLSYHMLKSLEVTLCFCGNSFCHHLDNAHRRKQGRVEKSLHMSLSLKHSSSTLGNS